ncbi:MAG: Precorrin-2 dehydrogenase [Syntrophorhabdaceae bacterium PtaU1.Bin034]|nr:MAG: Precorrin-2 dehydrogenase [Syntrophorhabdaceae bacterium PtaU1.Bin034]
MAKNSLTPYYPVFLDLMRKRCVVVGGGNVAERKVRALLAAGAIVKLVSPRVTKGLSKLGEQDTIEIVAREYQEGDLRGATLVFAATGTADVNRTIREETDRLGILLNVVDNPGMCDFIVPSLVRRGAILIAISTSGLLPMLSKKLRTDIFKRISADYALYARRVGAFRKFLMESLPDSRERRGIMKRVAEAEVHEVARMSLEDMKRRFLKPPRYGKHDTKTR